MKLRLRISSMLLLATLNFTHKDEIADCYYSFKSPTNLTAADPDRLPESARGSRMLKTDRGVVEVTCTDGYRILYNNDKGVPFVNLKVELSERKAYEKDKKNIIDNLKYLISHSTSLDTKDPIELEFNGFKIYGLSRATIETGSILGIFVMFPENDVTVYFYFNNLKPEFRNFENLDDYKMQRDRFMDEYTKYLKTCKRK
jgi:hypothetical protein